jgi:hypothetical protein
VLPAIRATGASVAGEVLLLEHSRKHRLVGAKVREAAVTIDVAQGSEGTTELRHRLMLVLILMLELVQGPLNL